MVRKEPLRQLELVHSELIRQRDSTADKHRTMYQRASLLIGAATVVTGVQAARIPAATSRLVDAVSVGRWDSWPAIHHMVALGLAVVATAFALIAAVEGMRAIMVEIGDEIDMVKFADNVLRAPSDLYTAEWSLVRDKLGVHLGDMERLEARRKVFTRGAGMLVVSWSVAILQFASSGG
jgi:hypothetical protein